LSGFKPITIQGTTYDFAHLAPLTLVIPIGDGDKRQEFKVLFTFGCHCFTETLDEERHTPDYHVHHDGETRAFCIHRYTRSLELVRIINGIGNKKVYFTYQTSFMLIELINEAGQTVTYTVFLEPKRGTKAVADVVVRVVSAYDKAEMPKKAATIKFHTLVAKVARGEKPTPPSPHHIKRK
jgi:hypothetical protein